MTMMCLLSLSLMTGALMSNEVTLTSLLTKDLANGPGREVTMFTVDFPPGAADPVHTHNAQGLIYVLEGSIVMQVKGGPQVTLKPGETFYEGPNDVHVVGRNASKTAPAKFLVVLIKEKGAPLLVPTDSPGGSSR